MNHITPLCRQVTIQATLTYARRTRLVCIRPSNPNVLTHTPYHDLARADSSYTSSILRSRTPVPLIKRFLGWCKVDASAHTLPCRALLFNERLQRATLQRGSEVNGEKDCLMVFSVVPLIQVRRETGKGSHIFTVIFQWGNSVYFTKCCNQRVFIYIVFTTLHDSSTLLL